MAQREQIDEEVKALEYSASEGVRVVAFLWFIRRVAVPLYAFIFLCIFMAFYKNGLGAGILSFILFVVPLRMLYLIVTDQTQKIRRFWKI